MNPKRLTFRLFSVIEKEVTPRDWALGFALGSWLAWSCGPNLQTLFGLFLIACVRGNLVGMAGAFLVNLLLRDFSHDICDAVGYWILTHGASHLRLWAGLYHAPLIPYSNFYETVTMGRLVLGTGFAAIFFAVGFFYVGPSRKSLFLKMMDGPIGYSWQHSALRHSYLVFVSQFGHPPRSTFILRKRAPFYLSGAAVVFSLGLVAASPWLVDAAITRYLTIVNNAPVSVGEVQLSLTNGELIIRDVAVTHHVQPTKNLLQIDEIKAQFEVWPLLSKKILLRKVAINGIQLDVAKPRPELESPVLFSESQGPNVMDRVAAQFFTEARNETKSNPFRYLVALQKGIDLSAYLRKEKNTLHSEREMARLGADVEALRTRCQLAQGGPQCQGEWEVINRRYRATEELVKADVDRLKTQLGFSQVNAIDLTKVLLGPRILQWMDRLGYWMDLSRRRMATSRDPRTYTMVVENAGPTTLVHYGKRSTVPSLLIEEITFNSTAAPRSAYGNVVGVVKGITNAPAVYGHPATGEIEFDFPQKGFKKTKVAFHIDHTGNANEERFSVESEEMPLNSWAFYQASDLYLGLEKAQASLKVEFDAKGDSLNATGTMTVRPVKYEIRSPYRQLQAQLQSVFSSHDPIPVTFEVAGLPSEGRLTLQSPFGVKVASALKEEFRQTQAAVEENLRREIEDSLVMAKRNLEGRLGQTYANFSESFRKTASVK